MGGVTPWEVLEGDCIDALRAMEPESVDAVVCDPPYGLSEEPDVAEVLRHWLAGDDYAHRGGGFMGKSWDSFVPGPAYWREALRVLRPGGHLLAFGGSRTYDLLAIAVRLAGFEIRDQIQWLYGSGFPKSLDVSKAIDKAAGAEREVVGPRTRVDGKAPGRAAGIWSDDGELPTTVTAPATPEAARWSGWGTALKPAHEPIVVARKPLAGIVAATVLEHGTGAINVDGCRIETTDKLGGGAEKDEQADKPEGWDRPWRNDPEAQAAHAQRVRANVEKAEALGRWPANVVLDEEAAALLDEQSGERPGMATQRDLRTTPSAYFGADKHPGVREGFNDSGGASRFFYCAKASSAERNAGLDEFEERERRDTYGDGLQGPRPHTSDDYEWQRKGARNSHPTVKPIELMRWLVRLVTPPGGTVLDPFAGSGTTGIACALEGFGFVGVERDEEYVRIARARVAWWAEHGEDGLEVVRREDAKREASVRRREALAESGQLGLLD